MIARYKELIFKHILGEDYHKVERIKYFGHNKMIKLEGHSNWFNILDFETMGSYTELVK